MPCGRGSWVGVGWGYIIYSVFIEQYLDIPTVALVDKRESVDAILHG